MGKRSGKQGSGGHHRKKFKFSGIIEPGQYGIYASCNRNKEQNAAKELKMMLNDKLEDYYPNYKDFLANDESDGEAENEEEELSIEDAIKKELEDLKKDNKDIKQKDIIKEIPLGCESLVFIKVRRPIVPSDFVVRACRELHDSKHKTSRFVQKMSPIDKSCNATVEEFTKLIRSMVEPIFHNDEQEQKSLKFSVNLVKRNFNTIDRDEINRIVTYAICGGDNNKYGHKVDLKTPDKLINVIAFKNNIGISIVEFKDFEELSKFNLQQIYDKSIEGEDDGSSHSRVAASTLAASNKGEEEKGLAGFQSITGDQSKQGEKEIVEPVAESGSEPAAKPAAEEKETTSTN